jgi:hypothetical protein
VPTPGGVLVNEYMSQTEGGRIFLVALGGFVLIAISLIQQARRKK